ncbi:hypothetical protein Q3G72_003932 [Acer saccharum]|nr:hypothetical protein Q3G72_003932 [Acer saccharum]
MERVRSLIDHINSVTEEDECKCAIFSGFLVVNGKDWLNSPSRTGNSPLGLELVLILSHRIRTESIAASSAALIPTADSIAAVTDSIAKRAFESSLIYDSEVPYSNKLRDSIHEVFDKENASEKDLDKTTDDALIAPPGTKNSSADCCYSVERQLSLL